MDSRRPKRRLYACLHCERTQRLHVAERYRMTAHVYRNHLALDQAPFFCTLCQFRGMTLGALEKHAIQPRHVADAKARGGGPGQFLNQYFNAKMVSELTDFRLATEEECKRRGSAPLEDMEADDSGVAGDEGLISIQVTPQMLADLVAGRAGSQPAYIPTPKEVVPYDPTMPGYVSGERLSQLLPPTIRGTLERPSSTAASFCGVVSCGKSPVVALPAAPTQAVLSSVTQTQTSIGPGFVAPAATGLVSEPVADLDINGSLYLPSFGDTLISAGLDSTTSSPLVIGKEMGISTPQVTTCTEPLNTPAMAETPLDFLGTPEPEAEDIREQLLGKEDGERSISPVLTRTDKSVQTKVSHTRTDLTPTATSMAITHLDETLKVILEKINSAVERNSRRVDEVNRTVGSLAESVARIERTFDLFVRRSAQERRSTTEEAREKRPRLDTKENHPPKVLSVVKDPKQKKRSGN